MALHDERADDGRATADPDRFAIASRHVNLLSKLNLSKMYVRTWSGSSGMARELSEPGQRGRDTRAALRQALGATKSPPVHLSVDRHS